MCAYPPSLFESLHILRKANKPDLKVAICKHVQEFASPTDSAESEQSHEHSQVFVKQSLLFPCVMSLVMAPYFIE